ncbi:MAG: DUF6456 domain-containing protein [Bauldia sp.]
MSERDVLRALRHLATRGAGADETPALAEARARGLVEGNAITATGRAHLRRSLAAGDFAAQHQERAPVRIDDDTVTVNHDESPLSWLRRRRDRDGRPLVDAAEFAAGERLRADYTRGQLMPRITANWSASVASRSRGDGASDITEVALAARLRVERALTTVGPELGGLLVDFCCFLKGLEEIERERRWPARSAKVALRMALSALARHYGLAQQARGRERAAKIVHWGTEDYRPTLD